MDNTKETIDITTTGCNSTLNKELPEIPLDEIVLNLGFWLDMAITHGKIIAQKRFNSDLPESLESKE